MCYPGIHECTRDDVTNRETTEEGPRFAKNNLVKTIVGVKRADKRRIDEIMTVEVGVTESIKKELVVSYSSCSCGKI